MKQMKRGAKTGVVLQQHYNNPRRLGIDIFNTLLNLDLDNTDYVIFDVRDINGRVYIDIDLKNSIPQKEFWPFFRQMVRLCREKNVKIYFGLPGLHNATVDYDNIVLDNGEIFPGRICPSSERCRGEYIDFLEAVRQKYGGDCRIFLPFFRYPPATRGLSCFCSRCSAHMENIFGRKISAEDIVSDFQVYLKWQEYRCRNISEFIRGVKAATGLHLALEVDFDPVRNWELGIVQNDCQDLRLIKDHIDECIVHFYDKSGYARFSEDRNSSHKMISAYAFFRQLHDYNLKYSLFFWNNGDSYEEFQDKWEFACSVNAETVFFLVNENQTEYINRLNERRMKR